MLYSIFIQNLLYSVEFNNFNQHIFFIVGNKSNILWKQQKPFSIST